MALGYSVPRMATPRSRAPRPIPPRPDWIVSTEVTVDGHRHHLAPGVELTVLVQGRKRRMIFRRMVVTAKGSTWMDLWDARTSLLRSVDPVAIVTVHRTVKVGRVTE